MHADLEKYVKAGKIPADFAARLDQFSPGKYVLHSSWGVGKVVAWSLAKQMVKVDFEEEKGYAMGLRLAFNQLTIIPEGHFLSSYFDDPALCRKMAEDKSTMLEFIRLVLTRNISLREGIDELLPMQPEDLERMLVDRVIPAASWKSWWERARIAMRDDPGFRLPTKRGEPIVLRSANSAVEALIADYHEASSLNSCVRILDQARLDVLDGQPDMVAKLVAAMEDDILKNRHEPQFVLELIMIRDDIMDAVATTEAKREELRLALAAAGVSNFTTLEDKLKAVTSEEMVSYIGELSALRQRRVYTALAEAFAGSWLSYTTNIFLFGGPKTTAPVAAFIIEKGEKEQLFADLVNGISRQSLSPDVLIWICRERNELAKELVDKSKVALGSAILNSIERDSAEGGPNRALRLRNLLIDDKNLAPDLVSGISEPESRPFAKGLYDSSVLADLDRNLLLANMMKVHPDLQAVVLSRTKAKEKQITYVSIRSYAARKAEYEDIVLVRIPKNKHDLEITRAEGDLRENGGYQDAKATRGILMRRSEELSRLLAQAEPTDFKAVDLSVTGMGTCVTLTTSLGVDVVYTILGAWDSIPEDRVISYSSRQGQKLCGHKVGAVVRVSVESGKSPVKVTVKSIQAASADYIYTHANEG